MSKSKKTIIIISIFIMIFVIIIVGLGYIIDAIIPKTYSSAKSECEKVLDKYQVEMEQIAIHSLKLNKNNSGDFKDYFYSCYQDDGLVKFDIDAQGMLGGQYWELAYTKDGTFYGESETYLYKETNGNNIVKAEKINGHWWYLWTDYDGTEKSYQ